MAFSSQTDVDPSFAGYMQAGHACGAWYALVTLGVQSRLHLQCLFTIAPLDSILLVADAHSCMEHQCILHSKICKKRYTSGFLEMLA